MAESYRKTSQWINRVRHQPGAPPSRPLHEQTAAEGVKMAAVVEEQVAQSLRRHQVTAQVTPGDEAARYGPEEKRLANPGGVTAAIARCAKGDRELATSIAAHGGGYEMTEATVAISRDEVGVKRQKERRQRSAGDEVAEAAPEDGVEHSGVSPNAAEPK